MAFWRGERLHSTGASVIVPFDPEQVDCNAYVMRMGDRYFRTSDGRDGEIGQKKMLLSPGESFVIPPGQFGYLLTKEVVKVPKNSMAFISMRTQLKFEGLINVSGFHVDPGYEGKLLYAVFNASPTPIAISENDPLFKIWFCDLDDATPPQIAPSAFVKDPRDGIYDIDNRLTHGMSPPILSLQGWAADIRVLGQSTDRKIASVEAKLESQRPTIDNLTFVYRTIIAGVFIAFMVAFITFIWPITAHTGELLRNWVFGPETQRRSDITSPTNQQGGIASPLPSRVTTPSIPHANDSEGR